MSPLYADRLLRRCRLLPVTVQVIPHPPHPELDVGPLGARDEAADLLVSKILKIEESTSIQTLIEILTAPSTLYFQCLGTQDDAHLLQGEVRHRDVALPGARGVHGHDDVALPEGPQAGRGRALGKAFHARPEIQGVFYKGLSDGATVLKAIFKIKGASTLKAKGTRV